MMHAKQTMLAAALTVGTPLSLLSAVQAVPVAAGTNLIAPFGFADCMANGDNWVEYEDWVASAGERDGVVVEDGVDADGVHYEKVLSDHCNAVLTSSKPVICLKNEGSVKVVNDVTHLSNVKKLCKLSVPTVAATAASFQSTTTYTALQSWGSATAPTAAAAALGGFATIQTQGTAFGEASLSGYCGDTGSGVAPGVGGAMRSTASVGNKIHCWDNLNDGLMGNANSWIPGTANKMAGVYFTSARTLTGIGLARDAVGTYSDRGTDGLKVEVSYTPMSTATALMGTTGWSEVGTVTGWAVRGQITWWKFASSLAGVYAIRIVPTGGGACIDELQIVSGSV